MQRKRAGRGQNLRPEAEAQTFKRGVREGQGHDPKAGGRPHRREERVQQEKDDRQDGQQRRYPQPSSVGRQRKRDRQRQDGLQGQENRRSGRRAVQFKYIAEFHSCVNVKKTKR